MDDQDNVFYRLGYTVEQARSAARPGARAAAGGGDRGAKAVRTLAERDPGRKNPPEAESDPMEHAPSGQNWSVVAAAGATALIGRILESMPKKRRPGIKRLLRAGAAGAGAALVRELVRSYRAGAGLSKQDIADLAKDAVISGAARGLLYGVLVEPRLPGPAVVRGAAYGAIEHLVTPMGGLSQVVGAHAPHRNIPLLSDLLDEIGPSDETLLEHILFGVTMAALYGALPPDPTEDEDDEEEDEDE